MGIAPAHTLTAFFHNHETKATLFNGLGRKAKKPFPVPYKKWGRRVVFDIADLDAFADKLPYGALDNQSNG
jgi:hypothetical protein